MEVAIFIEALRLAVEILRLANELKEKPTDGSRQA